MSYQLSAISYQLSAISYQLSAISYQLSAISYQLSAISYQLSAYGLQMVLQMVLSAIALFILMRYTYFIFLPLPSSPPGRG
ncbi:MULTISPECIES: hypothetical protein [unclassified Moorena]|uniref:hypothetical protein n=1 Tax=unclassified Moorena TaxID=2683338 RepID=UPI0013CC74F0|nr:MULTISPECIES: hypothetical protein [unclassified Moorena]NEP33158.1 hypothetical protein [Moorena sp. SIO3B2]NES45511.1 hypothetical protein [Moorena sp. SIO2C4]